MSRTTVRSDREELRSWGAVEAVASIWYYTVTCDSCDLFGVGTWAALIKAADEHARTCPPGFQHWTPAQQQRLAEMVFGGQP